MLSEPKKAIVFAILEPIIFFCLLIFSHGILNNILFYTIDGYNFSGYIWNLDITVIVSILFVYILYSWFTGSRIYHILDKIYKLQNEIHDLIPRMEVSKYPCIGSITFSEINSEKYKYKCMFLFYNDSTSTVIGEVFADTKKECFSKIYEIVSDKLN